MQYATFQERGVLTRRGHARLDCILGMLCSLGNAAIQERRDAWANCQDRISFNDQSKSLTGLRQDDPDWRSIGTNVARSALRRVDAAFNAFYRRCRAREMPGYPRFKPRSRYDCIDVSDVRRGDVKRRDGQVVIKLKGMPTIRINPHRPLPAGVPKQIRIVRRPTGCTVDLVFPVEPEPLPSTGRVTGIDLGVRRQITLAGGETIANGAETDWKAVRRVQRRIARSRRRSGMRRKRVRILARMRRKGAVRRRNACHRITSRLIRDHDGIAVEKLRIGNMTRSAAGTSLQPGVNVAAKRGLNRSILEQSWGMILQQLRYKAEWAGRMLREVDPANTSRDCHVCGTRGDPGSRLYWTCKSCGTRHDRDVNAARNILIRAGSFALESVTGPAGAVGSEILSTG